MSIFLDYINNISINILMTKTILWWSCWDKNWSQGTDTIPTLLICLLICLIKPLSPESCFSLPRKCFIYLNAFCLNVTDRGRLSLQLRVVNCQRWGIQLCIISMKLTWWWLIMLIKHLTWPICFQSVCMILMYGIEAFRYAGTFKPTFF